tara:strand:- start:270 stop:2432 length:2163 start_codon:yes stop_codon:yes gene_type:complete
MPLVYWITFFVFTNFNLQKISAVTNYAPHAKNNLYSTKFTKQIDTLSINGSGPNQNDSIQITVKTKNNAILIDSIKKPTKRKKRIRYRDIFMDSILIKNYKIFNYDETNEYTDTSLTIEKDYKFNYLRKDYFELLPMPNVGQGYNKMGYDFTKNSLSPQLGAKSLNYGYVKKQDIQYYEVPTPLSELFFKTTFEQGQLLDALISVNTSPNFNITIAHKGMRSLGNYVDSRTSATNLRLSTQYKNFNNRYRLRTHFVAQKLGFQENGGLDSLSVYFFEKAVEELDYDGFLDRSRLVTNIKAQNFLQGKSYHANQSYKIMPHKKDSLEYRLEIGHSFQYETKNQSFQYSKLGDYFGQELIVDSEGNFVSSNIKDIHKLRSFENIFYASYNVPKIGIFNFIFQLDNWNYFKDNGKSEQIKFIEGQSIDASQQTIGAGLSKTLYGYKLDFQLRKTLKEDFGNSLISFDLSKMHNKFFFNARAGYRTMSPNFNFFLFRSSLSDFNWNINDWVLQKVSSINAEIGHENWGKLSFDWQEINDFFYFKDITPFDRLTSQNIISPFQSSNKINYFKARFFQKIKFWKLGLINTIQFQDVKNILVDNSGDSKYSPLNVPKWITRTSLVLDTYVFKKALYIQTGATFQYFSKFFADRYNPLMGEFASQNHTMIGSYPRLDLFLNAKIQQTRFFLKYEHFNSNRTGYNFFSAPFVPYRDRSIRFGLVWNMFQ